MVAMEAERRESPKPPHEESIIDRWTYLPPYTLIGLMLFVGFLSFIFDSRAVVHPSNQDVVRQIIASRQSFAAPAHADPQDRTWWWVGGALLMPGAAGAFLLRVFKKNKKRPDITEFARMGEPKKAIILRKPDFPAQPVSVAPAAHPMPSLRPRNISAKALAISQHLQERKKQEQRKAAHPAPAPAASRPTTQLLDAATGASKKISHPAQSEIFKLVFGENWEPDKEENVVRRNRGGLFKRSPKPKAETEKMPPVPAEEEIPYRPLGIA